MTQVFETARLICRRWVTLDLDALFSVYSDIEGSRWVGDGTPITRQECEDWLQVTLKNYATRGYGMFALDQKDSGQTIGFCGLVHPSNQIEPEAKYAFLRSHWGLGYASEALPVLLDYGASKHGLTRIIATVAEPHVVSQRVLVRAGMKYSDTIAESDGSRTRIYQWTS